MAVSASMQAQAFATARGERARTAAVGRLQHDHESAHGSSRYDFSSGEDVVDPTGLGSVSKLMHQLGHIGSELRRITQQGNRLIRGPRRRRSEQEAVIAAAANSEAQGPVDIVKTTQTDWSKGWLSPRTMPITDTEFESLLDCLDKNSSWNKSTSLCTQSIKVWLPPPVPVTDERVASEYDELAGGERTKDYYSGNLSTSSSKLGAITTQGGAAAISTTYATPHAKPGELRCSSMPREVVNPMIGGSTRRKADQVPPSQEVAALQEYLDKHSLEDRLSDMMGSVLQERPDNPTEYLASKLIQYSSNSTSVGSNSSSLGGTSASTAEKPLSGTNVASGAFPECGNLRECNFIEPAYAPAESSGCDLWLRREETLSGHATRTRSLSMERFAGSLETLALPQKQAQLQHRSFVTAHSGKKRSAKRSSLSSRRRSNDRQSSSSNEKTPEPPWSPPETASHGAYASVGTESKTNRFRKKHLATSGREPPWLPYQSAAPPETSSSAEAPEPPWTPPEYGRRASGSYMDHNEVASHDSFKPKPIGVRRVRRRSTAGKQLATHVSLPLDDLHDYSSQPSTKPTIARRIRRRSASTKQSGLPGTVHNPSPAAHGAYTRRESIVEPPWCTVRESSDSSQSELMLARQRNMATHHLNPNESPIEPPMAPEEKSHAKGIDHLRETEARAKGNHQISLEPPVCPCPETSSDSSGLFSGRRNSGMASQIDSRVDLCEPPSAPAENARHLDATLPQQSRACQEETWRHSNRNQCGSRHSVCGKTGAPPAFWANHDDIDHHSIHHTSHNQSLEKVKVAAPKKKRRSSSRIHGTMNMREMSSYADGKASTANEERHEVPQYDPLYLQSVGGSADGPLTKRRSLPVVGNKKKPSQQKKVGDDDSDSEDRSNYFNEFAQDALRRGSRGHQDGKHNRGVPSEASNPTWKRLERLKSDVRNNTGNDKARADLDSGRNVQSANVSNATHMLGSDQSGRRRSSFAENEIPDPNHHTSNHAKKRGSLPKGADSETDEEEINFFSEPGQLPNSLFRRPSREYWESPLHESEHQRPHRNDTTEPSESNDKEMPKIDTELQASAQDVAHTPALSEAGTLAYTPTPGTAQGRTSMESKDLSPFDSTECTPGPHGNELTPTTPTRTDVEEESHIAPDTQTPFSHSQTVESIDVNHLSRGEQISALFKVLDTEHVGRLKENPMYVLAKALDYEDDEEVFAEYYKQTCESYSVDPDEGFDEEELAALLEEEDGEWFTHEDDIPSVMKTLQGGGGGGGGGDSDWCIKITPPEGGDPKTPNGEFSKKHARIASEETEEWSADEAAAEGEEGEAFGHRGTMDSMGSMDSMDSMDEEGEDMGRRGTMDSTGSIDSMHEEGEEEMGRRASMDSTGSMYEEGEEEMGRHGSMDSTGSMDEEGEGEDEEQGEEENEDGKEGNENNEASNHVHEKHKFRRSRQKTLTKQ